MNSIPVIGKTGTLAILLRIAGIVHPVQTSYKVTSRMWGEMVAELEALPPEAFTDPSRRPTRANMGDRIKMHSLTVINSGSDDPRVSEAFNREQERNSLFREKHDRFALRAGEKKPAIEYVDAESTHAVPDDLIKEIGAEGIRHVDRMGVARRQAPQP